VVVQGGGNSEKWQHTIFAGRSAGGESRVPRTADTLHKQLRSPGPSEQRKEKGGGKKSQQVWPRWQTKRTEVRK